jgi:hypothetical protein
VKSTRRMAFVYTLLFLLAGCGKIESPAASVPPTGAPANSPVVTPSPVPASAAYWSVEALTPDYPIQKIEVAGTYEEIGYALGR